MKIRGIVRQVDPLGRLVLAKEYRDSLGIKKGDNLEQILTKDGILIRVCNDASKLESYTDEELLNELELRGLK